MPPDGPDPDFHISGERTFIAVNMEKIAMATRERTYRCVGGPCDGMLHALGEERRIRLPSQQDVAAMPPPNRAAAPLSAASAADYDVRRLLAPDGQWHEFLVLSTWTSMQATVWLNRRPRR
jgi:hypothetical protein